MKYCILVAFLLLGEFFTCRAEAQIRNDVITGAFRCAAIGIGRSWLDCYYGAAQPLRVRLGLPPAPQAQIALAAAPPPSGPMLPEEAAARDKVIADALHCSTLQDERQWLDCYYRAAQPMRAQLKLSPVPEALIDMTSSQTRSDAGTRGSMPNGGSAKSPVISSRTFGLDENGPVDQFGLAAPSGPQVAQKKSLDHVTSRIADYSFNRSGLFTLRLANGQVWRQIEGDQARARLRLPPEKYVANIKHGFFHSYNILISGVSGLFRVRRVE
jgi:hypothetical protein